VDVASIVWLVLIVVFLFAEAATVGIVSVWFAAGSLVALILSLFKLPVGLQITAFILVSGLLLWQTRPIIQKYLIKRKVATNADRVIGMTAVVTETIDNLNGLGEIHVDGKRWTARSLDDEIIEKGGHVDILSIEGVKVIVRPAAKAPHTDSPVV
jgi:membrane protein implicated in regulation of membrane protease activity